MSLAHLWGTLTSNRRTRRARRDFHHDRRRPAFRWHRLPLRMEPLEERIAPDATPLQVALADHNATAVTLRLNGDELQVVRTDAPDDVLAARALVDVSAVNIVGDADRPEALTIDYDLGGFFWVPDGVTFDGGAGPGDQLLVQGGGNRTWTVTGADEGTIDGGVSFAGVENLIGGADNEDTFVIAPGGSVSGSLEGGAGGFDSLVIQDGGYTTVEASATGPDSGSVALDGQAVEYAGLEPVTLPTATNVVIDLTDGADVAELHHVSGDDFIVESTSTSTTFESMKFSVTGSTASVTVNLKGGADTITLTDLAFANLNNKLTIVGGDDSDTYQLGADWGTGVTLVEAGTAGAGTADTLDFGLFTGGPITITPGVSNLTISAAGGNSLEVANTNVANFESLTGANIDLTGSLTSVRTELVDGLKKVVDFARDLAAAGNYLRDLPIIGKNADVTIGKALDFAEALDEIRFQVEHFLDGTLPTLTTQDLIDFINDKFQAASPDYVGALKHLGAAIFANKPLLDSDIANTDVYDFKLTVNGTVYHVVVDVDASVTPSYNAGTKTLTFGLPDHGGPIHYRVSDMQTAINAAVSQVSDLSGQVVAALRNGRLAFQAVGTQINELKLAAGSAASAAATKLGLSTTDFVLSNVQQILGGLGDLNVSLASGVTLGVSFEGGTPKLRFDVDYHGSRASDFFYNLGSEAQSLGLAFDVQAKLHALAQLTADLKLGLGLTNASTVDFFLDVDALNAGVSLTGGAISGVDLNLGFLGLKANGSLGLEAGLSLTPAALATLHNVTDPSTIDVNTLGVTPTAGNGTGSPSFDVNLGLSVAAGTQDLGFSATGTLTASGNPFGGKNIDLHTDASFDSHFPDFNNLSAAGVVSLLGQVRTWLDGVRDSNAVSSLQIPFVKGGLDKILQLGDVVGNALLYDKGPDDVTDGADKLATDLNAALAKAGLDRLIRAEGNGTLLKLVAVDPKVTFFSITKKLGSDPHDGLPFDGGGFLDLGFADGDSSGTPFGSPPTIPGSAAALLGKLTGRAGFTVTVTRNGETTAHDVTLAKAATDDNTGVGDDTPKLLDANNAPTFTNTQGFVDRLAQILNLTFLHYDVDARILTLKINFDNRPLFGVELPTDFNLDLSPIGNVTSDTRLFIDAKGGINLTLGFDLSATPAGSSALGTDNTLADDSDKVTVPVKLEEAVTAATGPQGSVGQLSGDANFTISYNPTVAVVVPALSGRPGTDINVTKRTGDQSEQSIAVNPVDPTHMVIGVNDLNGTLGLNAAVPTDNIWFTTDGGAHWNPRPIPLPAGAPGPAGGDPTVIFSRDGKRVVYVHRAAKTDGNMAIAAAVSLNGGDTWPAAQTAVIGSFALDEDGDGASDHNDKEYVAVGPDVDDPNKDRFVVTWHRNNVIFASTAVYDPAHPLDPLVWSAPVEVGGLTSGSSTTPARGTSIDAIPSVGPHGEIFVTWEDYATPGVSLVKFDVSLDGGATWGGGKDRDVLFDTGKFDLDGGDKAILDQVVAAMTADPQLVVTVAGYTDTVGDSVPNQKLSDDRAKAVVDYLHAAPNNIALNRITQLGFGETHLAVPTGNPEDNPLNRRVELRLDSVIYTGNVNVFRDQFGAGKGLDGVDEAIGSAPADGLGEYEIPPQPTRGIWMGLSMDVDRSGGAHDGRIYLAFADQGDRDGDPDAANAADHHDTDIFVIASDNGGATWTALGANPVRVSVNDDGSRNTRSQFFSWLDVDQSSGNVAISWYDARNDDGVDPAVDSDLTPNTDVQYFASFSSDGGATWAKNIRVSDGSSNVTASGGNDYGDYTGLAFVNGTMHMTWADNSDSTGDNADGSGNAVETYYDTIRLTNSTIQDLIDDINVAIGEKPLLAGKFQARETSPGSNTIQIVSTDPAITAFKVTVPSNADPAFRDIGLQLSTDSTLVGGTPTVNAGKPAPTVVGQLTGDASFTVDLDGAGPGSPVTVTVPRADTVSPLAPNRNILDLVNDVQKAVNTALGQDKITVSSTNGRLLFTRVGTPEDGPSDQFVITPGANAAELGLTVAQTSDEADFVITTADGVDHRITLDKAAKIQDVIDAIHDQTGGDVTAALTVDDPEGDPTPVNEANTGLTLFDHTSGTTLFKLVPTNGSVAAVKLGIVGTDTNPNDPNDVADGKIVGAKIAGATLLDRFFITSDTLNSVLNAQLTVQAGIVAGGLSAVNSTVVTSSTYKFKATDVGKQLRVKGINGFTATTVTISSVDTGTNRATLSGSVGSAGLVGGTAILLAGVKAGALFGNMVSINLDGTASLQANLSLGFNTNSPALADGKLTLQELVDNLSHILDLLAPPDITPVLPATNFGTVDLKVGMGVAGGDLSGLASVLGVDPRVTINVVTLGDPFMDTRFRQASYTKVSDTEFRVNGNFTAKLPNDVILRFDDGSSTNDFKVTGAIFTAGSPGTTLVTVEPADGSAALPDSLGDPHDDTDVDVGVTLQPKVDIQTSGLGGLPDLGHLSFAQIIAALQALSGFLGQFEAFGFLNTDLPIINKSVNDLLSFAGDFAKAIEQAQSNPAGTLQVLEDKLNEAYGIAPDRLNEIVRLAGKGGITGATNATPIVITTADPHGLHTGDRVTITGVEGNTAANGTFAVAVIDDHHFSLKKIEDGSDVAGNGAYTQGGTWSPDDVFDLSFDPTTHIIKFDFTVGTSFSKGLDVAIPGLDFGGALDSLGLGHLVDLSGSAGLKAEGGVLLRLTLGMDIGDEFNVSDILDHLFVFNTTGLDGKLTVGGQDIAFRLGVGPFSLSVAGTPTQPAEIQIAGTAHAGLKASTFDGDGKATIDAVAHNLVDDFDGDLTGTISGTLPVFFPTDSTKLGVIRIGGSDGTGAFTTTGNLLNISRFDVRTQNPDQGTANAVVVDASQVVQGISNFDFSKLNIFDNIFLAVDGLDSVLGFLQDAVGGQLGSLSIPLIGGGLSKAAGFIGDLREDFIAPLRQAIETAKNAAQDFADPDKNIISKLLFDLLGPSGLDLLKPGPDYNAADGLSPADFIGLDTNLDDYLAGTGNIQLKDVFIQWDLDLGDTLADESTDIGFDLGIPGLGLKTEGDINVTVDWLLHLGFGLNMQDGFYLVVDNPATVGPDPELAFDVNVSLPAAITGTLGFLGLRAEDKVIDGHSTELGATFVVDLFERNATDAADRAHLGFTEFGQIGVNPGIAANASASLGMQLGISPDLIGQLFGSGAANVISGFPKVVGDFVFLWEIGDRNHGATLQQTVADSQFVALIQEANEADQNVFEGDGIGNAIQDGLKKVAIQDIGLDLGSFLSDVLGPLVQEVSKFTKPIQPLIDFVTSPIPIIGQLGLNITWLDLAQALAGDKVNVGLIKSVAEIITLVNNIADLSTAGDVILPIGNITIYNDTGTGTSFKPALWDSSLNLGSTFNQIQQTGGLLNDAITSAGGLDQALDDLIHQPGMTPQKQKAVNTLKEAANGTSAGGFSFPFLKDPSQIFGLLMGKDATLVAYDLAPLDFGFDFHQFFPIFGPLGVSIGLLTNLHIDTAFGYDTHGIREFIETGFRNPALLFDGFFISDSPKLNGVDDPELTFQAELQAAAELNLGIARAGVAAAFGFKILFDLFDPDRDGKIRIDELIGNITNQLKAPNDAEKLLAPLAIFDVSGEIYARLFAFLEIDFGFFTFEKDFPIFGPVTLLSFNVDFFRPPILATEQDNGDLIINTGKFAKERLLGNATDVAENLVIESDGTDGDFVKVKVKSADGAVGEDADVFQDYKVRKGHKIIIDGGQGNDTFDLTNFTESGVLFEVDLGEGNDQVIEPGSTAGGVAGQFSTFHGGRGDDRIDGTGGTDLIYGDEGNDVVNANAGDDLVFGDAGEVGTDTARGLSKPTDGGDKIDAGAGHDIVFGGGGKDDIQGGTESDLLLGGGGLVKFTSPDAFKVFGSLAPLAAGGVTDVESALFDTKAGDKVAGGDGDDLIFGTAGPDDLSGNGGNDLIFGMAGFDKIDAGSGDDVVFGDRGQVTADGPAPVDGGDADSIQAGSGNDVVYGGGGGDLIQGGDDNDTVYGGSGPDVIFGDNGGIDSVTGLPTPTPGSDGDDIIFGEGEPDRIFGGGGLDRIDGGIGADDVRGGDGGDLIIANKGNDILNGQEGGDSYLIDYQGGNAVSLMQVIDDGSTGTDIFVANGTIFDDKILLRANAAGSLAFVALINSNDRVERINYVGVERIIVNGSFGNDYIASDDTTAEVTINGDFGDDTFQVGQMFKSERGDVTDMAPPFDFSDVTGIAIDDAFADIETTRGFLSNGISFPMTINGGEGNDNFTVFHNKAVLQLNGEGGDDTFIIRAFALAGSQEPQRERTDISGGEGADLIQYVVNAPVNIDGGDGFDTVVIIGTEFGDDFVITDTGVFGAGLNVNFVNIESLRVDGAEGDDRFFVKSTSEKFTTELFGGLGNDTFNMSGDTPPIVSNDLLGHSGIITHDVESEDDRFDGQKVFGVSANVADNDEPFAVIRQTQGSTIVNEGDATGDSYQVVLTRAPDPGMVVEITVLAPIPTPTDRERGSQRFRISSPTAVVDAANNQPSADGTALVLRFTAADWFIPQIVNVFADGTTVFDTNTLFTRPELVGNPDPPPPAIPFTMDDDAYEGVHFGVINHIVNAHPAALPPTVKGLLLAVDNGTPTVTITDPGGIPNSAFVGRTLVISGGDGTGQIRTILGVTPSGSNLILSLDRPFIGTIPTTSSTFLIQLDDAIVGKVSSIQEDAFVAGNPDDHRSIFEDTSANFPTAGQGLTGSVLEIIGGPGAGQQRLILGQVAGHETAQLILNGGWGINPVAGQSTYRIKRFAGLMLPSVTVQVNDNDLPGLIVDETQGLQDTDGILTASDVVPDSDTITSVIEGGNGDHLGERDVLRVRPNKDPGGTIQVKPIYDASQLVLTDLAGNVVDAAHPLTFDSGDWSAFKVLVVRALADDIREGFHSSLVRFEIGNGSPDTTGSQTDTFKTIPPDRPVYFVGLEHAPIDGTVSVTLNGSPVAAATGFTVVGNKVVFLAGGTPTPVSGDISVSYQFTQPGFASAVTAPVVVRINDADAPTVLVRESGGSTDVVETASADPFWGDSYELVLTGAPTAPVHVTVAPQVTKTTRTGGIRHDLTQVTVSSSDPRAVANADGTLTVTFTAADWDDPVTVGVRAIDDGVVDGSDTQVFAPGPNTVSGILGPVSIDGAGGRGTLGINAPVMLPGEKNVRKSDGAVVSFAANPVSTPGALEQMVVNTADLTGRLADLGLASISDLVGLTIEMSKGNGVGVILDPAFPREEFDRFWMITRVEDAGGGHTRLTLQNPSQLNVADLPATAVPTAGSEYAITKLSANFFVDERTQVDYMFVHDEDSPADSTGYLTGSRLWGLNMGPDLVIGGRSRPGGITYGNLEVVEVNLGHGNNNFQVLGTHTRPDGYQTWTFVNTGDDLPFHGKAGDTVTVKLNAADVITATGTVSAAANPAPDNGFTVTATVPGTFADGSLAGQLITAAGQARTILGNVGGLLTLDRPWEALPTGEAFQIVDPADGAFAVNTQGGDDSVDASASTLGVVMFGGDGSDSLTGGSGDDIVFGDRGRVDYFNEAGAVVTRLGDAPAPITGFVTTQVTPGTLTTLVDSGASFPVPDDLADGVGADDRGLIGLYVDVNTGKGFLQPIKLITGNTPTTLTLAEGFDPSLDLPGPGSDPSQYRISTRPENQTDGVARDPGLLITVDNAVGGSDQIRSGDGNDKVFGGAAGDDILTGAGDDVVVGDAGRLDLTPDPAIPPGPVVFPPGGGRTTAHTFMDRLRTIDFATGGADTVGAGAGADLVLAGHGGDTVYGDDATGSAGAADGKDVVVGDNGEITFTNGAINHIFTTDTTEATGGADNVHGNAGDDIILGGVNNGAPDVLSGDAGNDMILGDNGEFIYNDPAHPDLATLDIVRTLNIARGGADVIYGNAGADLVLAGTGNDTGSGGTGDDVIYGDFAEVTLVNNQLDTLRTTDPTQGGSDVLYGNEDDDVIVGGALGDFLDGGQDDDLVFGDALQIHRRPGVISNPRFQALSGDHLYSRTDLDGVPANQSGGVLVNGVAQAYRQPAGAPPTWAEYEIIDLRHSAALEAAPDGSFGNDYIAGGTGDDEIFGQLGDDVIQGDGSIDTAVDNNPATPAVGAARVAGELVVTPSFETADDGDDYVEGNGGSDVIFGGLGQDDVVGGSSDLFTLNSRDLRPDGADRIFGGAGTRITRNVEVSSGDTIYAERHARDADAIAGDNADIFRIVGTNNTAGAGFVKFNYDSPTYPGYSAARPIIVRAVKLLDYTPGGPDFNPAGSANDIGGNDEVHAESGDDQVYGMKGSDALYGDSDDDDLVGGYGNDWMSGGTGQDGMIGDDGRLATSRNGLAEPLNAVAAIPAADLDKVISTPGHIQTATINVSGALKKAVDLTPFSVDPAWAATADEFNGSPAATQHNSDDIIFGGLGSDFLHGGSGDDAMSGAEAPVEAYVPVYSGGVPVGVVRDDFGHPVNTGDMLAFNAIDPNSKHPKLAGRTGEFPLYDEFDPMRKILLTDTGSLSKTGSGREFLLNFVANDTGAPAVTDPTYGTAYSDGNDAIFGDLGNDWLVGGTGRDDLYGGWGNDLLDADDDLTTAGGLNNVPDTHPIYEDRAFGGAGKDVLIANTGGDRLIDWVGEYNSYLVPFSPFGMATVSRTMQPQLPEYLYALSAADGADPTRAADVPGADATRNGEPFGELGVVRQHDAAWHEQTGAPTDPQPGNTPGTQRDVLRTSDFNGNAAVAMFADSGAWATGGGVYTGSNPTGDAVSLFNFDDWLPSYYEVVANIKLTGGMTNAFIVFDYQSATDFKYAGLDKAANLMRIGQRTAAGWIDTATVSVSLTGSNFTPTLAADGGTATLTLGTKSVSYTFTDPLNDGLVALAAHNGTGSFTSVTVQKKPKVITYQTLEDFSDGIADRYTPQLGGWTVSAGRYVATPPAGGDPAVSTRPLAVAPLSYVELQATVNAAAGSTAGIVFGYTGPQDFLYAAVIPGSNQVVLGHRTPAGWFVDAVATRTVTAGVDQTLLVAIDKLNVTVVLNGQTAVSFNYSFLPTGGDVGLMARNGTARFDNVVIRGDDPAFTGGAIPQMAAAPAPTGAQARPLTTAKLRPIVTEALRRWRMAGVDPAGLRGLTVQIVDLPGSELAETDGHTIRIDSTAAGWGWFVDKTPRKDTEFTTPGDQGEQHHMDLLTVMMHEIGHVLGREHEATGVMMDHLQPGKRENPSAEGLPVVTRQLPALAQDNPTHAAPLPPVKVTKGGLFLSRFFRR